MNGYQRTVAFVNGEKTDRPPFMPLVIEWVSRQQGLDYRDFIYQPTLRANAYLAAAERFHLDCILPDADFYEQLEDFGAKPVWGGTGYHADPILQDLEDIPNLSIPEIRPRYPYGKPAGDLKADRRKGKGKPLSFRNLCGSFYRIYQRPGAGGRLL